MSKNNNCNFKESFYMIYVCGKRICKTKFSQRRLFALNTFVTTNQIVLKGFIFTFSYIDSFLLLKRLSLQTDFKLSSL